MWLTMIWNYIKDPKNIIITALAVALIVSVLFGLSQYVMKNIKDASLSRANLEIDRQDKIISDQNMMIKQANENIKQIAIAQKKYNEARKTSQQINMVIEEAKDEKALVDARNRVIDFLNDGLRDRPADKTDKSILPASSPINDAEDNSTPAGS